MKTNRSVRSVNTVGTAGTLSHVAVPFERMDNYPSETSGCTRQDYRRLTNLSVNTAGTAGTLSHVQVPFARVRNYPSEVSDSGISQETSRREIRMQTVDSVATVGTLSHLQVPFARQPSPSPEVVSRTSTGSPRGILKKDASINEPDGVNEADTSSNVRNPAACVGGYASHFAHRDSSHVAKMVTVPELTEITRQISVGSSNSGGVADKNTSSSFLCCAQK